MDETRGAKFFTKMDLQAAYHQFHVRPEDQWKTAFRVPGGQYESKVGAFGLHGMSSLLHCYMHSVFGRPALHFDANRRPTSTAAGHPPLPSEVGGAASAWATSPRSVSPKILFCSKGDTERNTQGEKTKGKLYLDLTLRIYRPRPVATV